MDDWKLNTSPVVRLERPSKTFVHFFFLYYQAASLKVIPPTVCCTKWNCIRQVPGSPRNWRFWTGNPQFAAMPLIASVISVVKYSSVSVSVSFFTVFFPFQFRFSFCKFFCFSFSFLYFSVSVSVSVKALTFYSNYYLCTHFSVKSTVCLMLMLGLMFGMHGVLFVHCKLLLHSHC